MNIKKFHDCVTKEFNKIKLNVSFDIVKNTNIKTNIVFIFTMFRMNKPYKNDIEYTEGLIKNISCINTYIKNSIIRIYYDDSILKKDNTWKPMYDKLMKMSNTQLINYDFKQFKENSVFHKDLFGTLIRFLPLFNFYKTDENIMIGDIDYDKNSVELYKNIIPTRFEMIKKEKNIIFEGYNLSTFIDKGRLEISSIIKNYKFLPRILAGNIISSYQMDKSVFIEFIHCMYVKCDNYTTWLTESMSDIDCKSNKINQKKIGMCQSIKNFKISKTGLFLFGIDEFFINFYIFDALLSIGKKFYINIQIPPMGDYNYFLYTFMYDKKAITKKFIDNFQKFVLQDEYTDDINVNYKKIDSILWICPKGIMGSDKIKIDKLISDKENYKKYKLYSSRIHKFLYNSIKYGSFEKNLLEKSKKFRWYYKLYFDIILQIKDSNIISGKIIHKVCYENGKVIYKTL